tara:strand:- start:199 stop:993 length:795 start_codon:yes stop_codon:yes gene_type:complete
MSFKAALENTRNNQSYREANKEIQNINRDLRSELSELEDSLNTSRNITNIMGTTANLFDSGGEYFTNLGENITTSEEEGGQIGSLWNPKTYFDMIKGDSVRFGDKTMSFEEVGAAKNLQELMDAQNVDSTFLGAADVLAQHNPYAAIMKKFNDAKQKEIEAINNQGMSNQTYDTSDTLIPEDKSNNPNTGLLNYTQPYPSDAFPSNDPGQFDNRVTGSPVPNELLENPTIANEEELNSMYRYGDISEEEYWHYLENLRATGGLQ